MSEVEDDVLNNNNNRKEKKKWKKYNKVENRVYDYPNRQFLLNKNNNSPDNLLIYLVH